MKKEFQLICSHHSNSFPRYIEIIKATEKELKKVVEGLTTKGLNVRIKILKEESLIKEIKKEETPKAKKIQRIISESGTYISRNKWFQDSLIQQKIEAMFGVIFLFSGFTCQAIGNFASSTIRIHISPFIIFPSMVIILVILFLTFSKLIKYLTKRKIFKTEAIYHKDELDRYNTGSLDHCGGCLKILRERDEKDDDYKRRIKEKICSILKIKNIII